MAMTRWLLLPLLALSLLLHLWVYAGLLLAMPAAWVLYGGLFMLLIAVFGLVLLRPICRGFYAQAVPPPWIRQVIGHLSQRLGIRAPDVYALNTDGINAFALGHIGSSGVVFYHARMLAHLTQDEVEAVMAHELAHLAEGHAVITTFLQGMTAPLLVPVAACAGYFMSLLFGIRGFRQHFLQLHHMLNILLFPVTTVLLALLMRQWEYAADARAARLVGKVKYIAALQCLHGSFFQAPDLLNLAAVRSAADNDQWALSHPRLKQRIRALRELG